MISAISWVRRGAAKFTPIKCELDDSKMQEMAAKLNISLQDLESGEMQEISEEEWEDEEDTEDKEMAIESTKDDSIAISSAGHNSIAIKSTEHNSMAISSAEDQDLAKYNFDDYDKEPEGVDPSAIIGNFKDLLNCHSADSSAEQHEDPNLTSDPELDAEEAQENDQDLTISPSDILIVVANTVDEISSLEVYLYDEPADNLYVHHDLMIPSFPLCTQWIERTVGSESSSSEKGKNFIAVGTVEPEIEIWDLDLLDSPLPSAILGSSKAAGHSDSVMCLSAHPTNSKLLLSGSADCTIRLWDLESGNSLRTFEGIHQNKVQSIEWNPKESSCIASGSFDKTACVFDARTPTNSAIRWEIGAEIEALHWNPFNSNNLLTSDESGIVRSWDIRSPAAGPLFICQAHSKEVTTFSMNPFVPNVLFTASTDKSARLWFVDESGSALECVEAKRFEIGKIFAGSFCFDAPNLICLGGSKGEIVLWDLNNSCERFHTKYLSML